MRPHATVPSASTSRWLDEEVSRLICEGGDDRIVPPTPDGPNVYGCAPRPWFGGPTFSATTASPISPEAFEAAGERLVAWTADRRTGGGAERAAAEIRSRLSAWCGLAPSDGTKIVLAPSGTDLHRIAAGLARDAGRGTFVAVMPDPAETGRGVARALQGLRGTDEPFARAQAGRPGELATFALRKETGEPRPLADIDADCEAACRRSLRTGGSVLLVQLDVSKTGMAAPSSAVAAGLKAEFGDRVTVLVDACQFRLSASALRTHLAQGFLVAVTGSKFLGGPAFSGALLLPHEAAERMAAASFDWRSLPGSVREDWPATFAGRTLLPTACSLGPALRWAAALHESDAMGAIGGQAISAFTEGFRWSLRSIVDASPAVDALESSFPDGDARGPGEAPTIFPLIVKRDGLALGAEATERLYLRLRDFAFERGAGHLWIGQPVTVGRRSGQPLSAVRLSLSARHLSTFAGRKDGVGRLAALAEECLWTLARLGQTA